MDTYIAAVERLNANIAFNSSDSASNKENARLAEAGVKKMTQLYTKLVAEASSGTPPSGSNIQPPPFASAIMRTLDPIVTSLRAMPQPSTHPSHPAAPAILQVLKDAQKGYADVREDFLVCTCSNKRPRCEVHGARSA